MDPARIHDCGVVLDLVTHEMVKTEAAIDRYLSAFEAATMPEATCAPRIANLAEKHTELRHRRDELHALLAENPEPQPPRPEQLAALTDSYVNYSNKPSPPRSNHCSKPSHPQHRRHRPRRHTPDLPRPPTGTHNSGQPHTRHGNGSTNAWNGAPGRIRTCAPASGGRCSIP